MSENRFRGKLLSGDDAPRWWLGRFVRATVGKIAVYAFRTRYIGAERIPSGGAILAGNHASYLDPVLLWAGAPRKAHFIAKAELWDSRWLGFLLDRFWVHPVHRGTADRQMISAATAYLEAGELVAMFPEGTRSHTPGSAELGEAHGGVAFIALRADVPIVPVHFSGTDKAWGRGQKVPRLEKVTIRFGDPIYPNQFEGGRKERMEQFTAEVMHRIAALGDEAREASA